MRFKIDLPRLLLEENFPFLLCFTLYLRALSKYKLPGVFLRYQFGGLIFGGAYARRGLFSEFYGLLLCVAFCLGFVK